MIERKSNIAYIYNPQNQSKEQLIDGFVVRLDTFQKLFKEIKEAKMQTPEQHYLIQGKRGMGKTTLLRRLSYEIENDTALNTWLMPLVFNEEEYGISKLFQLWERIMELMWEKDHDFVYLKKTIHQLSQQIKDNGQYERALYDLLSQTLVQYRRKLILFIDNFGDIFNRFTEEEARRVRKILQTSADLRIFGAFSVGIGILYEYKHPFYEFFKIEKLSGLNQKATCDLLLKLSEIYGKDGVKEIIATQLGRIEALRRLTGGSIRSMVLLFDVFSEDIKGNAFKDLERILDQLTPLYKHIMDDLPTKQKEIVDIIALSWDAVTVKEICERMREESKVISAQLSQLAKDEIIEKIPTHTKNHLYQVSERFFNIWYLMRLGRSSEKSRVLWLTRFLEEWCDDETLVERTQKHLNSLRNKTYNRRAAYFMSEALANIKSLPSNLQHELLETTREYLKDFDKEYFDNLPKSDVSSVAEMRVEYGRGTYNKVLSITRQMVNNNPLIAVVCLIKMNKGDEAQEMMESMYPPANAIIILATLYIIEKNVDEAEIRTINFLKKCSSSVDYDAVFFGFIANLFNVHFDKKRTIEFTKKYLPTNILDECLYINILADVYLWNDQFDYAFELGERFLYEPQNEIRSKYDEDFLLLFLAKKQYKFLYTYFTGERGQAAQVKDRYKPIWYALMYFMREEYPIEYLRMGDELQQTVEEIIAKVEQMAIDYA